MIKTRQQKPKFEPVDIELDLGAFEDDDFEEVLRQTTKGVPPIDINHIELGDDYSN